MSKKWKVEVHYISGDCGNITFDNDEDVKTFKKNIESEFKTFSLAGKDNYGWYNKKNITNILIKEVEE